MSGVGRYSRTVPRVVVVLVALAVALALSGPAAAQSATTLPPPPTAPNTVAPVTVGPATTLPRDDGSAARTVNLVIAALVGLAVLVLVLTVWWWRSIKPVEPALERLLALDQRRGGARPVAGDPLAESPSTPSSG